MSRRRVSGLFAAVGADEYPVAGYGKNHVWLLVDDESRRRIGTSAVAEKAEPGGQLRVKVHRSGLGRLFTRSVEADVGGVRVGVAAADGDRVHVTFLGSPAVAEALGLTGDQHDGWSGSLPLTDLGPWRTSEKDLPLEPDW